MKKYAEKKHKSVSNLVEPIKSLTKPKKQETFMDLVEKLGPHDIDPEVNLKELYYQDKKHGL